MIEIQNPTKNSSRTRTDTPGARDDLLQPPPQESHAILGIGGEAPGDGGAAQTLQTGQRGEMASHRSTHSWWKARLQPGRTRTARPGSMASRQIGQSAASSSSWSPSPSPVSATTTPPSRLSSASESPFLKPSQSSSAASSSDAVCGVGGGVRGERPRATASKR
uniref:Uncharacterized protein n=1 Tax=Arundo donax TaxID=35708 RepID=A0A0A8XXQ0_ARUDO